MIRQSREHWVATVAEFERSELTQESFAQQRGIKVGTLRSWIHTLRREQRASVPLVGVRVVDSTAPRARRGESPEIEVELTTGIRLRFSSEVAVDYIVALAQRLG